MPKNLEHEVYSSGDKLLGSVWLEDGKVKSSSSQLLDVLNNKTTHGFVSIHEGEKFLQKLPSILNNGYMHAKKVK